MPNTSPIGPLLALLGFLFAAVLMLLGSAALHRIR